MLLSDSKRPKSFRSVPVKSYRRLRKRMPFSAFAGFEGFHSVLLED